MECSNKMRSPDLSKCIEVKPLRTCHITGKIMLTNHSATQLIRDKIDLHHKYKCPNCGAYHVSSVVRLPKYKKRK